MGFSVRRRGEVWQPAFFIAHAWSILWRKNAGCMFFNGRTSWWRWWSRGEWCRNGCSVWDFRASGHGGGNACGSPHNAFPTRHAGQGLSNSKPFLHSGQPFQVSSQKFTIFKIQSQLSSQPFSGLVTKYTTFQFSGDSRSNVDALSVHCRSIPDTWSLLG